ncbi:MAG: MFS transporter permease [Desulfobacter sp.]|nr:MFS transporter permease [Desulfobacter sp.]WDP84807.1 MAG: MFS transporter permease [Desulfobacter sp.]
MGSENKINIIPKEQAVFWMDSNGVWHNEHGRLEHPKIISYFNRSIQKDDQGYFLSQIIEDREEKVYFPYEETAIFVTHIHIKDKIELLLNTSQKIMLDPGRLYIKKDSLFFSTPPHEIKFTSHALAKISKCLKEADQGLMLQLGENQYFIPEK